MNAVPWIAVLRSALLVRSEIRTKIARKSTIQAKSVNCVLSTFGPNLGTESTSTEIVQIYIQSIERYVIPTSSHCGE